MSSVLKEIALNVPILLFVWNNVGYIAKVDGESMIPTLNPGGKKGKSDYVFLWKWSMREFNISRGQVVALISPKNPEQKLIKRVIALEGDIVRSTESEVIKIPKGHCWVEGDHRKNSLDSNHFGPVAVGLIQSHATHIIWPLKRWSKIEEELPMNCSYRIF